MLKYLIIGMIASTSAAQSAQDRPTAADCKAWGKWAVQAAAECKGPGSELMRKCQLLESPPGRYKYCEFSTK